MNPNTERITNIISEHSEALSGIMRTDLTPTQRTYALTLARTFLTLADEYATLTETVGIVLGKPKP